MRIITSITTAFRSATEIPAKLTELTEQKPLLHRICHPANRRSLMKRRRRSDRELRSRRKENDVMTGEETNSVFLSGEVTEPPVYSHSSFGEEFFLFQLGIVRRSGRQDEIRVLISRRLLDIAGLSAERGSFVTVQGQIRTYNQRDADKMHLRVFVFCHRIGGCGRSECGDNSVTLEGFVCRQPVHRISPLGREICDVMLAVNRRYGKSDYIPCIIWGRSAAFAASLPPGSRIRVNGRFQSRDYRKQTAGGAYEMRTAYEISVSSIETPEEKERNLQIKYNY